jgi:hypothetical protein
MFWHRELRRAASFAAKFSAITRSPAEYLLFWKYAHIATNFHQNYTPSALGWLGK